MRLAGLDDDLTRSTPMLLARTGILFATLTLILVTVAPAQSPQITSYGFGCPPPNGTTQQAPSIGFQGQPRIGQRFSITYSGPNHTVDNTQSGIQPFLMLGLQPQNVPIPMLFPAQPTGCVLWITPDLVIPMVPAAPQFTRYEDTFPIDVPAVPSLAGAGFFTQWFALFEQCGFVGCDYRYVLTSDAANVVLGL
jgi:hypothetical protein